ncbi:MAG TPA: HRDC domain-containing protein [Candidatus Kapabacteria bacterium]|nr:HRDC domain-containing protein [Candidatus Kapabacteria bacterium]
MNNRNNNNFENDTRVRTFQIQNSADEEALNTFLAGKAVRHWAVNFTPSASLPSSDGSPLVLGVWNVFVAYNDRETDSRGGHDQQNRQERFTPLQKKFPGQSSGPREHAPAIAEKRAEARKPVESYKPEVADQDFPLFESIRTWRNSRAREERVKPFTFFNNRQLEQIVTAKPADAPSLKGLATDMDPRLWEKYHKELLGFIDAARSTKSAAPQASANEPATVEAA